MLVYDNKDRAGVNLYDLFAGKNYNHHNLDGLNGFVLSRIGRRIVPRANNSYATAALVEGRGVIILSDVTSIARELCALNTNFFIEKQLLFSV